MYTSKRNTLWSALLLLIQFLSKGRVSVRVFRPPQFQWPRYAPALILSVCMYKFYGRDACVKQQCVGRNCYHNRGVIPIRKRSCLLFFVRVQDDMVATFSHFGCHF